MTSLEAGQRRGEAGRVGPAGVHRVEPRCRVPRETTGPFTGEGDLGALGSRVRAGPGIRLGADSRSSRSSRCVYCPPDVTRDHPRTFASRAAAGAAPKPARTARRPSSRNSPRCRPDRSSAPGRSLRRCRSGRRAAIRWRGSRDRATDRRATHVGDHDREPVLAMRRTSSSRTASSFPAARPTRITRAPSAASSSAASRPSPEVGPVTSTVRPSHRPGSGIAQPHSRRRTSNPTREKLATTVTSSRSSISVSDPCEHLCHPASRMRRTPVASNDDPYRPEAQMTRLHEQIETATADRRRIRVHRRLRQFADWDPGVDTSASGSTPGPLAVGSRYRLGVRMAAAWRPWSTGSPPTNRRDRVVLEGRAPASRPMDDIRFERPRGGTRIDYIADIRWVARCASSSRSWAGRSRLARDAVEGMQRTLDARAAAASDAPARTIVKVAVVGSGVSGLSRRLCPAATTTRSRCSRRERPSAATSRPSRSMPPDGPLGGRHGLHRLQRADLPDASSAC